MLIANTAGKTLLRRKLQRFAKRACTDDDDWTVFGYVIALGATTLANKNSWLLKFLGCFKVAQSRKFLSGV